MRVLVIEDSLVLIRPLCRMVEEIGFEACPVHSLAEMRLRMAQEPKFVAAIADYSLPDALNGEHLAELFQVAIPTIVLTSRSDVEMRERILQLPVVDYVTKESPAAFDYVMRMLIRIHKNPSIKVLIVDDSTSFRAFLREHLERHLYQVLEASNAKQALECLHQEKSIKLVLTDNDMPGMDGIRMTSTIRRFLDHDRLAIIGISSNADPTMTTRFIKAGADDYLQKPFNFEEFFCRVTRNVEFVENLAALKDSADRDPLTGLANRRYFFEQVMQLKDGYSLAVLDIDFFKNVNDQYGHDVGDHVICNTARLMEQFFPEGVVARFGGEEFVILSPNPMEKDMRQRLEDLRQAIESCVIVTTKGSLRYTVSMGMAAADLPEISRLLKLADERLYHAKQNGRNQICEG
ncbi:diguanylate cyclase [Neisseriaceae bacterium TC5R-5]|nr:diguanylate cyclase [Neisseriaceae bacterium TC5R-5]